MFLGPQPSPRDWRSRNIRASHPSAACSAGSQEPASPKRYALPLPDQQPCSPRGYIPWPLGAMCWPIWGPGPGEEAEMSQVPSRASLAIPPTGASPQPPHHSPWGLMTEHVVSPGPTAPSEADPAGGGGPQNEASKAQRGSDTCLRSHSGRLDQTSTGLLERPPPPTLNYFPSRFDTGRCQAGEGEEGAWGWRRSPSWAIWPGAQAGPLLTGGGCDPHLPAGLPSACRCPRVG